MTPESKKTMLCTMGLIVVAGVVLLAVGGTPA